MKDTIVLVLVMFMSLSAVAQFIPQQDNLIPPPAGLIIWSKCNSSWFTGTQSKCFALQTAPSNVMWCHCQWKCAPLADPIETGYKLYWSLPAGETGQGNLYSKNYNYYGNVYGTLTLYCGLGVEGPKPGHSDAYCTNGEIDTYPFTLSCDGGGQWP